MAFHRFGWLVAAVFFLAGVTSGMAADAYGLIEHLNTHVGPIDVHDALGPECGEGSTFADRCMVMTVDGKPFISNALVVIKTAFPSEAEPVLLNVYSSTGGNACCFDGYIVDLTRNPPIKMQDHSFGPEISRSGDKVTFQQYGGDNALGDLLKDTYTYELGSGDPVKIHSGPEYSTAPLTDKTAPWEVLGNPKLRGPIIAAVGKDRFKAYRQAIAVPDTLRKIGNYVVGSGCEAHACNWHYGMFVLDTADKLAWAAEAYEENDPSKSNAKVWGVLTPADSVPLGEIRSFLSRHHIPERFVTFAPLPPQVAKAYREPRNALASVEPKAVPQASIIPVAPTPPEPAPVPIPPPSGPQVRVPLESRGGTFVVPVTINGRLTLDFTLDSGAADVSIPADVVMTLIRTGTIGDNDFLGKQTYTLADGSTVPSQTFRIRSLKVGDHILENVVGSVAPVAGGLLLGQSFLGRFASWSIDNKAKALVLQ